MNPKHQFLKSVRFEETDFDADELNLLYISRYYFSCFAQGEMPVIKVSIKLCDERLQTQNSAEITASLFNVISVMRECRKSTFQFNSSTCCKCQNRFSECEYQLFDTIHSYRIGDSRNAWVKAMMLCEGNDVKRFLEEVRKLSVFLPEYQV